MNRGRMVAGAMLAAFGLGACAASPNFTPPARPVQTGYTQNPVVPPAAGAGATRQRFRVGAPVAAQWWRQFRSPQLDATVDLALADSPTLQQARATLAEARQYVLAARGALYPQVDLGAAASRGRDNAIGGARTSNLYSVGASVAHGVDVFGGSRRLVEQRGALVDVQRAQLDAARLTLAGNVVSQAIAMAASREQSVAAEAVLDADRRGVELVELSVRAGIGAPADLASARSQLAGDEALLPPLRQQRVLAADALAMLVGRSAGTWQPPPFDFTTLVLPADLPVVVPSALVRARPDIRAAEAQLHAASAAVGIATADLYPQISISASWSRQSATAGALFDGTGGLWTLGANLGAPLFHGGTLMAQRRAAVAAFRAEFAVYRQTVLTAFNQVADVLQALDHDAELVAAQRRALDAAGASLRLAQDGYAGGAGSYLQVLAAQRIYHEARLGYARATAQRYLDTAQWYVAMGGDHMP